MADNGTSVLTFPKDIIDEVLSNVVNSTALSNLVNPIRTTDPSDRFVYDVNTTDAVWHTNLTEDKTLTNDEVSQINVNMYDIYKIIKINDYSPERIPEVVNTIRNAMGPAIGHTIEKSLFGGTAAVASSPFGANPFGTPAEVDLTDPDALTALAQGTSTDPTGWVLNSTAKSDILKAYNKNSTLNSLNTYLEDGVDLNGYPAYFSKVGLPLTTFAGIVGDFSKAILVIKDDISLKAISDATSYTMMLQDAVAFKLKVRVGFAVADPAAFHAFRAKVAG